MTVHKTSSVSSALPRPDRVDKENTARLEDIFAGGTPGRGLLRAGLMFALSQDNPELLPLVEEREELATVILEKDGIPYINDDACNNGGNTGKKPNGDFAKLVESVVCNREPLINQRF